MQKVEGSNPFSRSGPRGAAVDDGGIDGGTGTYFANAGDYLHALGLLAPLADAIGCIVIRPDGSRVPARVVPHPLA